MKSSNTSNFMRMYS
uniref:Uncharacterized protein n=1 Tax=Anguilla anguilla TaxID=7936 RepID=A0A0E9V6B5_ANGAN